MGWHSYLQKNRIPFEGLESKHLTNLIFKDISVKAEKASVELAGIYGEQDLLEGYGKRNTTLLAIAPTQSPSSSLRQPSTGSDHISSNYYQPGRSKDISRRQNKYQRQ